MKKSRLVAVAVTVISLVLAACFSPYQGGNEGLLTIDLGGSASRSWGDTSETDNLDYVITISGAGPTQIIEVSGTKSVTATVTPGSWTINVKAYVGAAGITAGSVGDLYAETTQTVSIKPGKNNPVSIRMARAGDWTVGIYLITAPSSIQKGTSATFDVTVFDKEMRGVNWTVEGRSNTGTGFGATSPRPVTTTGTPVTLYADFAETATVLTVTAASHTDPSKKVVAYVAVTD